MPHREIIEDVCENCLEYCILKEILLHSGMNDRTLEQFKCVEKFKFERSRVEGKDIGWREAHRFWIEEGYAKKFAEIYEAGMTNGRIYELIMKVC